MEQCRPVHLMALGSYQVGKNRDQATVHLPFNYLRPVLKTSSRATSQPAAKGSESEVVFDALNDGLKYGMKSLIFFSKESKRSTIRDAIEPYTDTTTPCIKAQEALAKALDGAIGDSDRAMVNTSMLAFCAKYINEEY